MIHNCTCARPFHANPVCRINGKCVGVSRSKTLFFFSPLKKSNAASKSYTDYIMTSMIAIASFERRIEGERKKGDNSFGSK